MDQARDLRERLKAPSIPELRRRIDRIVGYLREIRCSIAVHAGMMLEQMPGPVPAIDHIDFNETLAMIVELLPVLRTPLSPEEKKSLRVLTPTEKKAMEANLEALLQIEPEVFNKIMEKAGADKTYEDLVMLKEEGQKMEMLGEVMQEIQAIDAELQVYKDRLTEKQAADVAAILRMLKPKIGPAS